TVEVDHRGAGEAEVDERDRLAGGRELGVETAVVAHHPHVEVVTAFEGGRLDPRGIGRHHVGAVATGCQVRDGDDAVGLRLVRGVRDRRDVREEVGGRGAVDV